MELNPRFTNPNLIACELFDGPGGFSTEFTCLKSDRNALDEVISSCSRP